MCLDVLFKVVAAHETFSALRADEPLVPRVNSKMALEFVRPGKTLAAVEPVAHKWPLPGVQAKVRLQMRRPAIGFRAVRIVADVPLLPWRAIGVGGLRISAARANGTGARHSM